jgi:hypothetical protein
MFMMIVRKNRNSIINAVKCCVNQTTRTFLVVRSDGLSFDRILKNVTPTIGEEILTFEKLSRAVSVYPLRYAIWSLEIILKT